jgi:hypothetical protein
MSINSSLLFFIAYSIRLLVVFISLLYIVIIFHHLLPIWLLFRCILLSCLQFHPCYHSSGSFSLFLFSLCPLTSHLYSFGNDFPLCAYIFITFSRRCVISSSLLLLKMFLPFLLSLIPCKPFPVYLYLPVSYFHLFSSISLFSSHLS